MNYCVVSKQSENGNDRVVLMSFAQKPLWKTFKTIHIQNNSLPNCWDKKTANYALNKYANKEQYEIISFDQLKKEYEILILHWSGMPHRIGI